MQTTGSWFIRTWTKYDEGNPVLPNPGKTDFRDPKVNTQIFFLEDKNITSLSFFSGVLSRGVQPVDHVPG